MSSARERASIIAAVALIVGLMLGGGGLALTLGHNRCDRAARALTVFADPAVAPAISTAADRFNESKCASVKVTSANSADTAGSVSSAGPSAGVTRPEVWIPDSSLWTDLVRQSAHGRRYVTGEPVPIASSPLVFVTSAAVAPGIASKSWADFRQPGSYVMQMLDPSQTSTGMASLLLLQQVAGSGTQAIETFTTMIQDAQVTTVAGARQISAAYTALTERSGAERPILIDNEQSAWRQSRATPSVKVVYPAAGTANLDFPYAITTLDSGRRALATEFREALQTSASAEQLHRIGLRTPDGTAGSELTKAGLADTPPRIIPVAQPGAAAGIQETWRRMHSGTRALALLDVSGSMDTPMPGRKETRIQAATKALSEGVAFMPDDAEFGLWSFASDMDGSRPYKPLTSIAPLREISPSGTQRSRLQGYLGQLKTRPGTRTGLYDSIQAAYQEVTKGFEADKINIVLVMTDGRNDNPGGIGLDKLVSRLKKSFDVRRPVSVIAMGFGKDVDMASLTKITKATDGGAYQIEDPRDIMKLFMESVALRACDDPRCPK